MISLPYINILPTTFQYAKKCHIKTSMNILHLKILHRTSSIEILKLSLFQV